MNTHTPGPFHVEKHCGRYEIWPKDNGQTHTLVGVAQTKSDADLFAAAPELLAACQSALAMLTSPKFIEWQTRFRASDSEWAMVSAMDMRQEEIESAIAKATEGGK